MLLCLLDAREARTGRIAELTGMKQPAVSQALTTLADRGLVRRGKQRSAYVVARPREVRAILRGAALVEYHETGNPEALELAERLRKQDMRHGADEASSTTG